MRLLRSNDINLSRAASFFPGDDFPCPERPGSNSLDVCGLEVVNAQQVSFGIDAFFDEDQAQAGSILGPYDIYVRWTPVNTVPEIFRTLEAAGLGVWTIGEDPEGVDYSVRHIEVNQAVQTDDNVIPMVADKRTVVRLYPQVENLPEGKFFGTGVAVSLRGQAGQDGPSLGGFTGFTWITAGPNVRMDTLRGDGLQLSANFILPREWTQVEDLLLTATVNLDDSGDPIVEESSIDNNTKSESFPFSRRKTIAIGYLEACRGGCDDGVHNADRFLRKVFPAAETSGVAYIPGSSGESMGK